MKKILINFKLIILHLIIFHLLFFNISSPSMFPNAYQYQISKTDLKTRELNGYSMPFVDAQMAMPLQETGTRNITCYIIAMFTKSTNTSFGDSFAIDRKSEMLIAGDDTINILNRDIRAEFIGGTSDTIAKMSLLGKQNIIGCKILIQFPFEKIITAFPNWFLSIRTSFINLEQQLKMNLEGGPENALNNIRDFFTNKTTHAKINSKLLSNTGLENITISLDGIYQSKRNRLEIYYYTGIEIPTSLSYTPSNLFYPIVGNNGNIGLLLGADMHIYFHNRTYQRLGILFELENHFLLYKTVNRTFDLFNQRYLHDGKSSPNRNKAWSRYLPVLSLEYPEAKKVVADISNLPTRVHECNMLDISLGLIYNVITKNDNKFYFAAGYNLWMSQPEYLELQDRVYQKQYHNFYNYGIQGVLPFSTSSETTIKEQLEDDLTINNFTINNLDYGSIASDGGYSQTIFLRGTAIGYSGYSVLLGAWYEIGKAKMIPSRIGFWIGGGMEF